MAVQRPPITPYFREGYAACRHWKEMPSTTAGRLECRRVLRILAKLGTDDPKILGAHRSTSRVLEADALP
jgi:hypothetical protein